jgi:prolyl oligopeptidase
MQLQITIGFLIVGLSGAAQAADAGTDPYQWLEEPGGPRVLQWIHTENQRTLAALASDARFARFESEALAVDEAQDRIPMPAQLAGGITNFWRDAQHVRGIWRRTSEADYLAVHPRWKTVLDLDALARAEHANWVWHGAECAQPAENHCLLILSDGGEDAATLREFDLAAGRFVKNGFILPRGKQDAAWLDADTLIAAREWAPGELTASGYPYVVKTLSRGQPLAAAREIFRGDPKDVGVTPTVLVDGAGHQVTLINRSVSFFETEIFLVTPAGATKLALPLKSQVVALVDGQVLVSLAEDWQAGGTLFAHGSLVALDLAATRAHPDALVPVLVYAPGPREALGEVQASQSALVVTTLQNVNGRAFLYRHHADGSWSRDPQDLPGNSTIVPTDASPHGHLAFVSVTSFLEPTRLYRIDTETGARVLAKSLPAKFDASRDTVEQLEATSSDGVKIPYFVIHPTELAPGGRNPAVLNAYGGFQVSETPFYSGVIGKLWLERGGTFVLANIRGGGEFGPAWHEAGLKTHRQIIYDDFAAVARDLATRGISDADHLGIMGGSNGGLLMGVELTQHPELFRAVDIQVPLLDMLRYEQIAAGPSWVGEYGSVANPDERAFLAGISPYANLRAGVHYPDPFVWTTSKDDRVGPQHARKFAARLAELGSDYLFYEVIEGGHGAGANLKETARTQALEWVYFSQRLQDAPH